MLTGEQRRCSERANPLWHYTGSPVDDAVMEADAFVDGSVEVWQAVEGSEGWKNSNIQHEYLQLNLQKGWIGKDKISYSSRDNARW